MHHVFQPQVSGARTTKSFCQQSSNLQICSSKKPKTTPLTNVFSSTKDLQEKLEKHKHAVHLLPIPVTKLHPIFVLPYILY